MHLKLIPYIIYRITCTANGKIYIGQTRQTLKSRMAEYRREVKSRPDTNRSIISAMRKYGFESFVFEEIDRASTLDELNERETYWIKFYRSEEREIGYNLQAGGSQKSANAGMKKGIRCIETGELFSSMAEAARLNGFSPASLTLHMKGASKTCNGHHWEWTGNKGASIYAESEPVKEVFRKTSERQKTSKTGPRTRVRCTETGEVFDSMNDAAKKYNTDKRNIFSAMERGIACAGFHWERLTPKRTHNKRGCVSVRPVKNIDTGQIYPSLVEAAKAVGVMTAASIWCAIRDKKRAGGFYWEYAQPIKDQMASVKSEPMFPAK